MKNTQLVRYIGSGQNCLTSNKMYKLENISYGIPDGNRLCNIYYWIINDFGVFEYFNCNHFVTLEEDRNNKLNKILNEII